jgi:hypothetical protein
VQLKQTLGNVDSAATVPEGSAQLGWSSQHTDGAQMDTTEQAAAEESSSQATSVRAQPTCLRVTALGHTQRRT